MRKFSRFAFALQVALPVLFLLATTPPAAAKIVEFTATLKVGIGDGGNASTPSNQPNGLPICNKGLITHLNASVPAHGFVEVANSWPSGSETMMKRLPSGWMSYAVAVPDIR
jgi:hypothetical protein